MHSHRIRRIAWSAAVALLAAAACARAANLIVTPWFPGYGQAVDVQLDNVGPAPFIPAARYRRDGSTIVVEQEHVSTGYFGVRLDMDYVPLALGELAPGDYAIQARLYDIANPDAAPLLFVQGVSVAAPDRPGVYSVPRAPNAFEALQLVVRGDSPIAPGSVRASVSGNTIRVDFDFSGDPAAPAFGVVSVPGLAPGSYQVDAFGRSSAYPTAAHYSARLDVANTASAVEFYAPRLEHYFVTASPDEIAAIEGNPAAGWMRTGERFKVWLHASEAPSYAVPVCRFYAAGPGSHFYSAIPAECGALQDLEAKERADAHAKGQAFMGWQYEGIAFYAVAPQDGACPAGTRPVYRAYNNRAPENDSNHRFTASPRMRAAMAMTWGDEGVAFCSPS